MQHVPQPKRQTFRTRTYSGSEYVTKIASAIAKEHSVKLKLESRMFGGVQTRADMTKKEVTLDLNDLYTYGDDFVIGALLHEIGHIKHSPHPKTLAFNAETKTRESKSRRDTLMMLYNMLEDKRVNAKMAHSHAGAPYYLSAMYTELLDVLAGRLEAENITAPPTKEIHHAQAVSMVEKLHPDWTRADFNKPKDEDEEKLVDKRIAEHNAKAAEVRRVVAEVVYRKDALMTILALAELEDSELYHVAKRYPELHAKASELVPLMKRAADSKAPNERIAELTEQAYAILEDYIPPPLPPEDGEMPDGLRSKMRQLQPDDNEEKEEEREKYKSIRQQWKELTQFGIKPQRLERNLDTDEQIRSEPLFSRAIADSAQTVAKLTRALKAHMRENEHQRFTGNKRKGLLNKRSLARTARDNFRVYRKREERKGKKYAVSVVLDTSGSMWHDHPIIGNGNHSKDPNKSRITTGMRASAILTKTFRALGFTSSLTIYGRHPKRILDFSERLLPEHIVTELSKLGDGYYASHSNETHEALAEAIPRLRKEAAKNGAHGILVVITDGGLDHTDITRSKEMLNAELKKGGLTPTIFYVGTHQRILNDDRYERSIESDATKLITEAVALLRSSILEN